MSLIQMMLPSNIQRLRRLAVFLSLLFLFLFLHGHQNFIASGVSVISLDSKEHDDSMVHRKVLSAKFDFTPLLHHHMSEPHPSGQEVDPLYEEEKRRVPSGPNPLHH
ncbi:hypothetical protein SAY86_016692 [Trapa natans]|uniref:Uncharacterized protein n=1 Tax=Trapa natans TaxID=22666 RepID=A0AAN7LK62_TRANT|nr:hypothetical protein SAY86_016692 [Trapa natans]